MQRNLEIVQIPSLRVTYTCCPGLKDCGDEQFGTSTGGSAFNQPNAGRVTGFTVPELLHVYSITFRILCSIACFYLPHPTHACFSISCQCLPVPASATILGGHNVLPPVALFENMNAKNYLPVSVLNLRLQLRV